MAGGTERVAVDGLRQRLDQIEALAELGSWEWDPSSDQVTATAGLCRLIGLEQTGCRFTFEEFLGGFHPDDRAQSRRIFEDAMRRRESFAFEHRIIRRDNGVTRLLHCRGSVAGSEQGGPVRLLGVCQDVTEQRAAEARQRRRRIEDILESTADAVVALDYDFRFTFANHNAERVLRRSADELVGRTLWEAFGHDHPDFAGISELRRAMFERVPTRWEQLYASIDLWIEARVFPSPGGVTVFFSDVSERRQMENELREREERFRLAVRATEDVIYDFDVPSGVLHWSDAVGPVFRYAPADLGEQLEWWEDRIHPDDRRRVLESFTAALEGDEEFWTVEYRFRRGDGTYAAVLDRGYIRRDPQGRPIRMIGSMADLTERNRLEEQVRQSQKMEAIGQLAGGVAHDFNNLLTAIRGSTELLATGMPENDPRRIDVDEIQFAVDRAASLTRQLLAFSRRQVVQPQVLDVNAVVQEMDRLLHRVIGETISLDVALDPAIGPVRIDPGQLQQVLLNLAINARDAMPGGGILRIETGAAVLDRLPGRRRSDAASGPHVRVRVSDTGIGMTEEIRSRLFEPFFTTKEVGRGTGLGLPTVYGIMRQAAGRIEVESAPGAGTRFTLYFPVYIGEAERPTPQSGRTTRMPGGNETILLVEDDAPVRAILRRVLQAHGYTVLEARNGTEALTAAAAHTGPIDLVISDVVMPEMGGRELVKRLAADRPGLRVLLMSGYTENAVIEESAAGPLQLGFIEKPFVVEELLEEIRRLLDRRAVA